LSKLKIAVIGAGLIGRKHIALIQQSNECNLEAVVDPDEATESLATEFGVPRYNDLEALLAKQAIDGVILATPNHMHYSQAMSCICAGVAILIEKPITQTVEQAMALVDAVNKVKARVIVGHHRMHSAIMKEAKAIIERGDIGDVVAVQGSALLYKPDDYFLAGAWRTKVGGGPILINMIHEVGSLRYLCGEIVQVQAMPSNAQRGFEVEDTVAILLRFENGAVGTFLLSDTAASCRSWEQTACENLDYHHEPLENCYHIAGTRGSLSIPTMTVHRFDSGDKPSWYQAMTVDKFPVDVTDPLQSQLEHFCRVIRREEAPLVSAEDGYRNLLITEQIADASA
jgi:predicted dehydrogenase